MSGVARTVLGDVPVADLGVVDAHDHLMIRGGPAVAGNADLRLDDVADAVAEAEAFAAAGGGAILDAMPSGCGGDAGALAEISRRSGVHVIAASGLHKQEYYDDLHWARRYDRDALAEVLLAECRDGIDVNDNAGPLVSRTAVRPGVLKIATGYHAVRPMEASAVAATAEVHRATGLGIITHADHGTLAHRQLDLLEQHGVSPERVAIGHLDRDPDLRLHASLAARGCWLGYDGLARERYRPVGAVIDVLRGLLDAGYGDRILLGGDVARRSLRRANGGPGIAGVLTDLAARLRSELGDEPVGALLRANPARFLTLPREGTMSATFGHTS